MSSKGERDSGSGYPSKRAEEGAKKRARKQLNRETGDKPREPKWNGLSLHEIIQRRDLLLEFHQTEEWKCPDNEREIERKKIDILEELSNFDLNKLQWAKKALDIIKLDEAIPDSRPTQEVHEARVIIKYLDVMNTEQQNLQTRIRNLDNLAIQTDQQLVTEIWHAFTLWIFGSFLGLTTRDDPRGGYFLENGHPRNLISDLDQKVQYLKKDNPLKTELCAGRVSFLETGFDFQTVFDFKEHYHFLNRLHAYVKSLRPIKQVKEYGREMSEHERLHWVMKLSIQSLEDDIKKRKQYDEDWKEWHEWDDNAKAKREAQTRKAEHQKKRAEEARKRKDAQEDEDDFLEPAAAKKEEKKPEYEDWDDAEVETAKGTVFNPESYSQDPVDEEQNDDAVDSASDAGDPNALPVRIFDATKEYIPDSTSNLKFWDGRPLPTFRPDGLPRKNGGGVDWASIDKNILCVMIQRMVVMYLYNCRTNKVKKIRQYKFIKALQEYVANLKHDKDVYELDQMD